MEATVRLSLSGPLPKTSAEAEALTAALEGAVRGQTAWCPEGFERPTAFGVESAEVVLLDTGAREHRHLHVVDDGKGTG
jgi:hypothetical protein